MLTDAERQRERRYSTRWNCRRAFPWRIRRGRRLRDATLCERSLNGMVLAVPARDAAREGAYVLPPDLNTAERHGFRLAVVRRTRALSPRRRLLYVEILA